MIYTFTGPKGGETTVSAPDEAAARRFAMITRWGRTPNWRDGRSTDPTRPDSERWLPTVPCAPDYLGHGLDLISTTTET